MKKTLSINLSGLVFDIDEDAYSILKHYLDSITRHFENNIGKEEIISDIENRIAEDFSERKNASKQVITKEDVERIINTMGQVEDFSQENAEQEKTQQEHKNDSTRTTSSKRFYRDMDNAMIGGVASGLAQYFGVDVTLVRILFILFLFLGGSAILVYIVLWIITPRAETAAQRAEMTGEPLTIQAIEKHVKKIIDEGKERFESLEKKNFGEKIKTMVNDIFHGIERVFGKIFGLFLSIITFLGLIALGIAMGGVILNGQSFDLTQALQHILTFPEFLLGSLAVAGVIFFPLLTLFFLGIWLVSKKSLFKPALVGTLMFFWATSLIVAGTIASKVATFISEQEKNPVPQHFYLESLPDWKN